MLKYDRQNYILAQLQINNSILSNDIIENLDCSLETLRRDLIELEKEGKLVRAHGGAYLPEKFNKGIPITLRETMLVKEKDKMADLAFSLIKEHDLIFLDHSSTCARLANRLSKGNKPVTVVTNSIKASVIITSSNNLSIKLICTGGTYNSKNAAYAGKITIDSIKNLHASKAFISCPFISREFGLTGNSLESAEVRKTMIKQADQIIMLMDHTKINGNSDVIIADLQSVDTLVTDRKISGEMKGACQEHNIKVIYN